MKKHLFILVLCFTLAFCGCSFNSSEAFADYTSSLFCNELSSNTLNLHYTLTDPYSYGIDDYHISFGDFSREARANSSKQLKSTLSSLRKIKRCFLSDKERLDYDIIKEYLETQLSLDEYELYGDMLSPSNGTHAQLPILLAEYEFRCKRDIEDYLKLLSSIDTYFTQIIDFENDKSKSGLFMQDSLCVDVISECERFIAAPEDNLLIKSFSSRVEAMDCLSDSEVAYYIKQNNEIFTSCVIPAYKHLISGLTALLGTGRNNNGLYYYPDGQKYYELLVKKDTGSSLSIDELYDRINQQRCSDLAQVSTFFDDSSEAELLPGGDNLSPEEMINSLQQAMLKDFPPICDTSYSLCKVDPSLKDSLAPAFYITAPFDDYSNNSIYINSAQDYDPLYLFTTLAHEGYPGHLYQTVMSYDSGLSPFRTLLDFSGYVEGWATYVEMQSYYYAGLPETAATFLQCNQSVTLSLYASCDIGIHYYGWTFDKTCEFWNEYGITDDDAIQEIMDYILADPGNYLKYYVGYLEFMNLKNTAQGKYGDSFDAVNFHRAILEIGPAPFDILDKYLDSYYSKA